ncbi:MAG: AI-2E family transporter [Thermoleophilaceae bacterium]|nr:AI-2E family transporter [Thermoleophilaceae bacterium]
MAGREGAIAYRAVLLAAGLLVLGLLFQQLVTLLLAVLITVIIAIPVAAAADLLERIHIPRALGALLAMLAGIAILLGIFALVVPPFVDEMQEFVDDVPTIIEDLEERIDNITGAEPGEAGERAKDYLQRYLDRPGRLAGPIASIGLGVAGALGAMLVVLVTAYFIAVSPDPLLRGLRSLVPPGRREDADRIMSRMRSSWLGWMGGLAIDMTATAILLYFGLQLIGLEFASLFAILAALFTVVPYYGAFISGLPPVLLALADSPGKALLVILLYTGVQQFEASVTVPVIMARAVKLHPAVIAVGVLVVAQLFGFLGLVVAVPILTGIVILVDELWVKPMDAGEPPGAPV